VGVWPCSAAGTGARPGPFVFLALAAAAVPLVMAQAAAPGGQGLTLVHFRAQLEDLRDTSLTLELNLSTFGKHPRVSMGYMGDKVSLS
jgi:hypothetical protein